MIRPATDDRTRRAPGSGSRRTGERKDPALRGARLLRRDGRPTDLTYIAQAEACLTAAAAAADLTARALHEEECRLWLILASQRRAIEAVMQRHLVEIDHA